MIPSDLYISYLINLPHLIIIIRIKKYNSFIFDFFIEHSLNNAFLWIYEYIRGD